MEKELKGRRVLVTGASKGVGAALAKAFGAAGAQVCLTARNADALEQVAAECRDAGAAGASCHPCDLTDPAQVEAMVGGLLEAEQGVEVLLNVAGAYPDSGKIDQLEGDPDAWDAAFAANLQAPMRLTRLLAPRMTERGQGTIVNVGSVAGLKGPADEGSYAASKWGMRGWSLSCYEDLRQYGIKVVLIEPAHIATDMAMMQGGTRYNEVKPELMIQPEDVVEAAMLAFRMGNAVPAEIVLNRQQTPYA